MGLLGLSPRWFRASSPRASVGRSRRRLCSGSRNTVAPYPGGRSRPPTASGSPRSCSSRPGRTRCSPPSGGGCRASHPGGGTPHPPARFVSARLGGELPDDPEGLRRLPGIGRYTANAIASIAFGKDVPVVDGNVSRVLSRLFAIESDITAAATQERLWALATELLPRGKAATFNPALMEFGSARSTA